MLASGGACLEQQERQHAAALVGGAVGWVQVSQVNRAQQGRLADRYHACLYPPAPVNTIPMMHSLEP